jgi:hypothetical protein
MNKPTIYSRADCHSAKSDGSHEQPQGKKILITEITARLCMTTKIELGSFSRGEHSPIMLKKKIERDGSLSVRIYQRKDIDSITSFKDKVKTMMKYGIEDFCMKHEKLRPILQSIGVNIIERLNDNDTEDTINLLQSIRSEARTGAITKETETEFKKILGKNGLSEDYRIDFYEGKYKNNDFFSDLNKFMILNKNFLKSDRDQLLRIQNEFVLRDLKDENTLITDAQLIQEIKDQLKNHFENQYKILEAQPEINTESAESNFPKNISSDLKDLKENNNKKMEDLRALQQEIEKKFDEIKKEIIQRSTSPKR